MKPDNNTMLKPVLFVKGKYNYHRQNLFQQNLLLKALQVTTDPQELKTMIGVKTVAEVYRTLDKLAIRKEYHEALLRHGMDLDAIILGVKGVITDKRGDGEFKESGKVRLSGWQILLKSMGLDSYEETPKESRENWEDIVRETARELDEPKKIKSAEPVEADYEVIEPDIPEDAKALIKRHEEEQEIGRSLYE